MNTSHDTQRLSGENGAVPGARPLEPAAHTPAASQRPVLVDGQEREPRLWTATGRWPHRQCLTGSWACDSGRGSYSRPPCRGSSPPRPPLSSAIGRCCSRKHTPVLGLDSATPTGHQVTLTLLGERPCALRTWRSPVSPDGVREVSPRGGMRAGPTAVSGCPRVALCVWRAWAPGASLPQAGPVTQGTGLALPERQRLFPWAFVVTPQHAARESHAVGGRVGGNLPGSFDGVRRLVRDPTSKGHGWI